MLANAAEVREGLLYVLGGGIEQLWVSELPAEVAPAVVLSVELEPADLGRPFTPHLVVRDPAGRLVVDVDLPPARPEATGSGGTALLFPMVFTVGMRVVEPGPHRLEVRVGAAELASVPFVVHVAP